jgi:membrane protein
LKLPGKGISWKELFRALREGNKRHRLIDSAAALTFFGILSFFPFLLFVTSLASVVIGPAEAPTLIGEVSRVAPSQVKQLLFAELRSLGHQRNAGLLSLTSVLALWAASRGVRAAMRSLNVVYDVEEGRSRWQVGGISLVMTVVLGAFGLVAVLLAVAPPAFAGVLPPPISTLVNWLHIPVAGLLMMISWALALYVLPDVEQRFKLVTPETIIGVVVWACASWCFSLYVQNFGRLEVIYGALGGVIVLLLWMWISSLVLLFSAEMNAVLEQRSPEGKAKGRKQLGTRG